jgi:hypothetical protein
MRKQGVLVVAKGFQDGRQFLRSLKREKINNQPLATILNLTLTPNLTRILTQTLISILESSRKLPLVCLDITKSKAFLNI